MFDSKSYGLLKLGIESHVASFAVNESRVKSWLKKLANVLYNILLCIDL